MERLQITEQDVRDYCRLRMPVTSPQYVELHEEFVRDPVNSRVGQFCRETERVVRRVMDGDLDWEALLFAYEEAEKALEVPDEGKSDDTNESGPPRESVL